MVLHMYVYIYIICILYTYVHIYIRYPFPTKCDLGVVVPQIKLQLRGAQVLGMELEPQEVGKPRECLLKKTIVQYFYIHVHMHIVIGLGSLFLN